MGCDEIRTIEMDEEQEKSPIPIKTKNLCIKMYTGVLQENMNFTDSLIKNHEELEEKLRSFIPTKIIKDDSNIPKFNTKDEILTKCANIDFNDYFLIAINGVNRVTRVEEENGNYLIFNDNQPGYKNKYIALVVTKIGEKPDFFFDNPKQAFLDN